MCVSLNLLCKDQRGNDLHELLYGTVLQKVSMHICELISAIYETRCIYSFIYWVIYCLIYLSFCCEAVGSWFGDGFAADVRKVL